MQGWKQADFPMCLADSDQQPHGPIAHSPLSLRPPALPKLSCDCCLLPAGPRLPCTRTGQSTVPRALSWLPTPRTWSGPQDSGAQTDPERLGFQGSTKDKCHFAQGQTFSPSTSPKKKNQASLNMLGLYSPLFIFPFKTKKG